MKATYHPSVHKFALFVVCWTVGLLGVGALTDLILRAVEIHPESHCSAA